MLYMVCLSFRFSIVVVLSGVLGSGCAYLRSSRGPLLTANASNALSGARRAGVVLKGAVASTGAGRASATATGADETGLAGGSFIVTEAAGTVYAVGAGFGLDNGHAVSAVLTFRLATYWLPTLPGWFTFRWMQTHEEI
jgi:hypothetical protein